MDLGNLGKGILGAATSTLESNPLGLAVGAGQMIAGAIQKKKAKGMLPPPEDVGERQLLNTLRRRQQALTTGTAYNPQITAGKQMARSLAKTSFNAGGPVNQGAYTNLVSQTMNNITQQTQQDIAQTLAQQGQLATQMANRKADLTLLQRNEMMADAAENRKAGFQNLSAAMMPQKTDYTDTSTGDNDLAQGLYSENQESKKKIAELMKQIQDLQNQSGTQTQPK